MNSDKRIKPWLIVWRLESKIPVYMACEICGIGGGNKDMDTAVTFYKAHRHCGMVRETKTL